MAGAHSECLVSHVSSVLIVCRDCGHAGVFFPEHFRRWGVPPLAPAGQMTRRFRCAPCRSRGADGQAVTVEIFPVHEGATA